MNTYLVQYKSDGTWVPFMILSESIYSALKWTKENIQRNGVNVELWSEQ